MKTEEPRERVGELIEKDGNEKFLKGSGTEARAPDDQGTQDKPLCVF